MTTTTAARLELPDATLYYEVRGSGPVLLIIPGGPADAGTFGAHADALADRYTVVTYDCRGNSRSTNDGRPEDLTVQLHSDDARRLLDALGSAPAFVLGSSGGATYGLDLVARNPGRVRTFVAHEPPVLELLPDAARWRALNAEVVEIYRNAGVFPALQKFGEETGLGGGPPPDAEMTPEAMENMSRMMGNLELFVGHLIPQISGYVPDIEALRTSSTQIVLGVGESSTDQQLPLRATHALAERLGVKPVGFPGDHGFGDPEVFAARLHDVLIGAAR